MKRKFISKAVLITLSTVTILSPMETTPHWMPVFAAQTTSSNTSDDFVITNGLLTEYNGTSETVIIPDKVKKIAKNVFLKNDTMTHVVLPENLELIDETAFSDCSNLKEIEIPSSVTWIASGAFSNCTSLEKVTLPDNLETLTSGTFTNCSSLTQIDLPKKLKYIEGNVFSKCTNLSTITFPETILNIGPDVFKDTKWLEDKQKEDPLVIYQDILIDGSTCTGTVTVPEGVKTVSENAFGGAKNLTEINLPNSLKTIYDYAFANTGIINIRIPDKVTYLGDNLWQNCDRLINIAIPKSVTQITKLTFAYNVASKGNHLYQVTPSSSWIVYVESGSETERILNEFNATLDNKIQYKDISQYEATKKETSTSSTSTTEPTTLPTIPAGTVEPTTKPNGSQTTTMPSAKPTSPVRTTTPSTKPTASAATTKPSTKPTIPAQTTKPTVSAATKIPSATATIQPSMAPIPQTQEVKVTVAKSKIKKLTKKSGTKMSITIQKVNGANGYQIIVATDKNFTKILTKTTTQKNTYLLKNLKKKKTYYIKVRAYKLDTNNQKVYGTYSSVKKKKWK